MAVLYVNSATGDDSRSYATAQNQSTPWATIGRAVWGSTNRAAPNTSEAAAAGDTVIVTAGTYVVGTGHGDKFPFLNPANSGTAGNLITFQSSSGYTDLQFSSGTGGMIGANSKDYIKWQGFRILEASAVSSSDTGPIVVWDSVGSVIDRCYVDGNGDPGYGDNHNGIRIEDSSDLTISNNTITNVTTSVVNGRNGAGIMAYSCRNSVIENNDISSCGCGIYLKGESTVTQYGYTVRKNLVHDCVWGMYITNFTNAAGDTSTISQNIVRNCSSYGLILSGDVSSLYNVIVSNNTINACGLNLGIRNAVGANQSFINNLSTNPGSGSNEVFHAGDATSLASWSSDYEMYYGQNRWSYNSTAYTTLANWRTAISDDTNSSVQDPLYVNAGTYDFHLQVGSPALTASSTGGPVGAYITGSETIGPTGDDVQVSATNDTLWFQPRRITWA